EAHRADEVGLDAGRVTCGEDGDGVTELIAGLLDSCGVEGYLARPLGHAAALDDAVLPAVRRRGSGEVAAYGGGSLAADDAPVLVDDEGAEIAAVAVRALGTLHLRELVDERRGDGLGGLHLQAGAGRSDDDVTDAALDDAAEGTGQGVG